MKSRNRNILILFFLFAGIIILITQTDLFNSRDCITDINQDRVTDSLDLAELKKYFGKRVGKDNHADLNGDSVVNILDMNILLSMYGKSCE
jgi:hypothetical protein